MSINLASESSTQVLIVGGGLAGLSEAMFFERGYWPEGERSDTPRSHPGQAAAHPVTRRFLGPFIGDPVCDTGRSLGVLR